MPRIQGTIPPPKPAELGSRFSVAPTCDGYEVVDNDGRPVTDSYEFANRPLEIAATLNTAASLGKRNLARALGAIEDDDVIAYGEGTVEAIHG